MKTNIKTFWDSISFCLNLALKSSICYTLIRVIGNFAIPVISMASAYIIKVILDTLANSAGQIYNSQFKVLIWLMISFGLSCLSSIIQHSTSHAIKIQSNIIQNEVFFSILKKAISSDIELYDSPKFYDKFNAAKSDAYSVSSVLWNVLDCISALFSMASAFLILLSQSFAYSIIIITLIIPIAIANQYYTKKIYKNDLDLTNSERQKEYLFFLGSTKEYAAGIRCWDLYDVIKSKYLSLCNLITQRKRELSLHKAIVLSALAILPEIGVLLISFQIARNAISGRISVGDYTFYTGILAQLIISTTSFITCISAVYDNKLKIENMAEFNAFACKSICDGTEHISKIESITFKNVTFRYPKTRKDVLTNVTFSITPSNKIAIVGKNGAGKSTIFKLLLRFYDATSGEILINDKPIQNYVLKDLHLCFGIYLQNSPSFAFTVLENITLYRNHSSRPISEIVSLFEKCNANDIRDTCNGNVNVYLTKMFSDDGIELSIGQQQKLAIMRALYSNASCYVLDEPSSALDPESEMKIFHYLEELFREKCAIFISHRLSNTYLADEILVLEHGKVVERGTQSDLIKRNGVFSKMYKYQAQKFTFEG